MIVVRAGMSRFSIVANERVAGMADIQGFRQEKPVVCGAVAQSCLSISLCLALFPDSGSIPAGLVV